MFQISFLAGAGDFDYDGRFRGAAWLDRAKDARMMFFAAHGFRLEVLRQLRLSPLVLKEKIDYQRDLEALEEYKMSLTLAGLSADGSRFMTRCEAIRADGKVAAKVTSTCGWLDSNLQKLTTPPPELIEALKELPMSADYQALLSALK